MRVALTFDTEPASRPCTPGNEQRILAALAETGARATFFLQGRWVRAYPGLARRIARAGHLIGNHSNFHAPMPSLTEAGVREDVGKAHAAIETLVGVDPRPWFRCPFGAGMDDPIVRGRLAELGYSSIGWNCAPQDWRERRTGDEVRAAVLAGADRVGGGDLLVVMHSWPDATAAALPGLLAALAAAGASFAGVDELGDTDRFLAGAPPA